jgi:cyanophycinase
MTPRQDTDEHSDAEGPQASAAPVALVGSGEFLPVMRDVDAGLLAGRPPRVAVLPTAAGLEGDERVDWWLDLAAQHYGALGMEMVAVRVLDASDADDPDLAALIDGVGLVYLSGGDPHHLAATLEGSLAWKAIRTAWLGGAALAGCSAGAMALTAGAPPELGPGGRHRPPDHGTVDGLRLVGHLAVIPHFDLLQQRRSDIVEWFAGWKPTETTLVGVEEDTALVSTATGWRVHGRQAVWVFGPGTPERFVAGDDVALDPPGMSLGPTVLQ